MMDERTKFYKEFEGKRVIIKTQSNFTYNTDNLLVFENAISFRDKFGNKVLISFDEILKLEEVKNGS